MAQRLLRRLDADQRVELTFTDLADGDLAVSSEGVAARRAVLEPRPWTWLRQVHSADAVVVREAGDCAGHTADASVTDVAGAVLAVQGADCAPLLFWSDEGPIGAAHAGWRGVERGIIAATADAMRGLGARTIHLCVGPYIHPSSYEFGANDLARLRERFGPAVISTTAAGRPALDVGAAIRAAAHESGIGIDHDVDVCTASSRRHYSHRCRRDSGRHAGLVVRAAIGAP